MQSLKKIHAWAQVKVPLWRLVSALHQNVFGMHKSGPLEQKHQNSSYRYKRRCILPVKTSNA